MVRTTLPFRFAWGALPSQARKAKPRIPERKRIYAVGDVHGRADLLAALFDQIDDDLRARPIAEPLEVFLGDYIDRGPSSRSVLDLLIARRKEHQLVLLMGNHELYASEVLNDPSVLLEWIKIGAVPTLLSYGVRPPGSANPHPQSLMEAAMAFRRALPDSHRHFLRSLALSFACGDFFFTHAGVRPGIPLQRQTQEDLLWIRDEFLLHEGDFGGFIVHGHTPTKEPDTRQNRINIDTGAYATGRLTCLVLEADQMTFL